MLLPLGVALATVSAGTWLAVAPREGTRSLRVIRWLALVSAVGVIALHLVPEAFEGLGLLALLGFAAGLGVPSLLEIGTRALLGRRGTSSGHGHGHGHDHDHNHEQGARDPGTFVSLELAYLGLLAHRFGDGLSLGAAEAAGTSLWGRVGVLLAVAAHIVPVTAVMILAIADARGRGAAVLHGAGLAVATMAGVIAAGAALGADALASGHAHGHSHTGHGPHAHLAGAWISAVVAGLLLHIVLHDMPRPFSSGDAPGRG